MHAAQQQATHLTPASPREPDSWLRAMRAALSAQQNGDLRNAAGHFREAALAVETIAGHLYWNATLLSAWCNAREGELFTLYLRFLRHTALHQLTVNLHWLDHLASASTSPPPLADAARAARCQMLLMWRGPAGDFAEAQRLRPGSRPV
jgi:hypothetical protein